MTQADDEWNTFADWWAANYRSLTQTLNSQGIALSAWNAGRRAGVAAGWEACREEAARVADDHMIEDDLNEKENAELIAAAIRSLTPPKREEW
jgi:hypothetical protein